MVNIIKSYNPKWSVSKKVVFRRRDAVTHEDDRVTVGVHADGTIVAQTTGPEAEVSPDDSSRSTKLLADIVFVTDTNDEYLIDVTVAAPSASSYVNSRTSSSDIAGQYACPRQGGQVCAQGWRWSVHSLCNGNQRQIQS